MTIKFGLAFASSIAIDGEATSEICRRAEAAGFESLWGGEHVILPSTIESPYPYSSDGKIPAQPDTPFTPLREQIKLGYVRGITAALDEIGRLDPRYQGFTAVMRNFAARFQLDALADYLEQGPHHDA